MKFLFISVTLFVSACSSSNQTSGVKKTVDPAVVKQNEEEKNSLKGGNELIASGSEPDNWNMQINFDKNVTFESDDGLKLSFAFNKLKSSGTGSTKLYTGRIDAGNVTIGLKDGVCTVPAQRSVYSKSVKFIFNGKEYNGCGKYLADQNLIGKWQLQQINKADINLADYNKPPGFVFDLSKNRVSGTDGCNSIGGDIEVQGSRIKFSQMISTQMACAKKDISAIISTKISNQLIDYYFKEGKLYLYLIDDSVLVFIRGI